MVSYFHLIIKIKKLRKKSESIKKHINPQTSVGKSTRRGFLYFPFAIFYTITSLSSEFILYVPAYASKF